MQVNIKALTLVITFIFFAIGAKAQERIIVKYKPTISQSSLLAQGQISDIELRRQMMHPLSVSKLSAISAVSGYQVSEVKAMANGAHVLTIDADLTSQQLNQVLTKLKQQPDVDIVELDELIQPNDVPDHNPVQWDMLESTTLPNIPLARGDNFITAWNMWQASHQDNIGSGIVVAVIDSGYTPNSNIINNLQPVTNESCVSQNGVGQCYGYQFISDCRSAGSCPANTVVNTNLSPQPDGLDLGDFVSAADTQNARFSRCRITNSSWHGTHVTGTVVADGFNSFTNTGVLGGAYGAKVVPLRALGKCGGFTSDIVDAIYYAVNRYPGLTNPHPADVVNMSLGSANTCPSITQQAIDEANAHGAIVVVAAGNSTQNISGFSLASCSGVVSVAAKGLRNELASYSNFGATTITASGGNRDSQLPSPNIELINSTFWSSLNAFHVADGGSFSFSQGTSMAAPHVSAALADIIGLLKSRNIGYDNAMLISILENSASFDYLNGSASNAGGSVSSGMLDVGAAFNYVMSNMVDNSLTASSNNIILTVGGAPSIVTFTNNTNHQVSVESAQLLSIDNVEIVADNCSGNTVAPNGSCSITLASNNRSSGDTEGSLRLFDGSNNVLSTVAITTQHPSASNGSGGGGGGCSFVAGNHDYSMMIILFILALYYVWRKVNTRSCSRCYKLNYWSVYSDGDK